MEFIRSIFLWVGTIGVGFILVSLALACLQAIFIDEPRDPPKGIYVGLLFVIVAAGGLLSSFMIYSI